MSCFVKSASRLFAVPDRIAVSRKRVSGLFAAAALSLAASQAQAVGFQRISLPMDMNGPALQGAAWYPCDAPEVEITVGRSVIAGTPDCPMPAGADDAGGDVARLGRVFPWPSRHGAGAGRGRLRGGRAEPHGRQRPDRSRQGYLSIFSTRPREIRRLIDYMTGAWPGRRSCALTRSASLVSRVAAIPAWCWRAPRRISVRGCRSANRSRGCPCVATSRQARRRSSLPEGCPRQGPGDRRSAQCVRAVGGRRGRVCPAVGVRAGR